VAVRVVRTAADQDGHMTTDQGVRMAEIQVVTDITEIDCDNPTIISLKFLTQLASSP
jgi:hypothetical protein